MNQKSPVFGEELRRRRLTVGLSLAQLARMVHYSKGQLSKVERGLKAPSRDLARLCDAALGADGELASLVSAGPASRRQVLTAGALAVPALYLGGGEGSVNAEHAELADIFCSLFDHYRQLGQANDPDILIPVLTGQANMIQEIARNTRGHTYRILLTIASRYAEYTGWLLQEAGTDSEALRWTLHAVALANAAGDSHFAAYGLVRHALVAMYRGDAAQTVQLATGAQAPALPPRIRGLAAVREAQGHAIAADYDSAMRAIDRAGSLLSAATVDPVGPVIGTGNLANPAEMIRGWCLYDLGRPGDAAQIIDQQLASIPETHRTATATGDVPLPAARRQPALRRCARGTASIPGGHALDGRHPAVHQ